MLKPEIKTTYFKSSSKDGTQYACVRLLIGDDFFIDVGCKNVGDNNEAQSRARVIATEVEAALTQLINVNEAKNAPE